MTPESMPRNAFPPTLPTRLRIMAAAARSLAAVLFAAWALSLSSGPAAAVGGFEDTPTQTDSARAKYEQARSALDAGRPADAIALLEDVVKAEPRNANAWNLLAYANRKLGKLDVALAHYRKALALDPEHRGAHEYLGELYLQKGDLASAEQMRARLKDICVFECEELEDLDKAIAAYKSGKFKPVGAR